MIKFLSRTPSYKLKGTALLRLDLNTKDSWRLDAALPTVRLLGKHAAKIIIVSHRGRPAPFQAGFSGPAPAAAREFSLKPEAAKLRRLLKKPVHFLSHFNWKQIEADIKKAPKKSVFLLENLRFLKGEGENSSALGKQLASLADFYVNEAFAMSHRANASVVTVTKFLPSYGGLGLEGEIKSLGAAIENPAHPLVFVLGGGKASDKLGILKYFKDRADYFLLGGAAANSLLFLKGANVRKSLRETHSGELKKLKPILKYKNIFLPVDFKWSGGKILDIGPTTAAFFERIVGRAKTLVWSGPLGLTEQKTFAQGSIAVAGAILRNKEVFSISGGGETVMFLREYGFDKKFSFISTGGGAMLEFLAGQKLPGIKALENK